MQEVTNTQQDTVQAAQNKVYAATLRKTRRAMNRLLNEFLQDSEADTQRFRAEIYALRSIAEVHRLENEQELEKRLETLEEIIQERGA